MSNDFYIALAQIEQVIKGKRVYTEPGRPVHGLSEEDAAKFLAAKVIRLPTADEAKLEALLRKEADEAAAKATAPTGRRRKGAAAEGNDGGSDDDAGNENSGGGSDDSGI